MLASVPNKQKTRMLLKMISVIIGGEVAWGGSDTHIEEGCNGWGQYFNINSDPSLPLHCGYKIFFSREVKELSSPNTFFSSFLLFCWNHVSIKIAQASPEQKARRKR